MLIHTHLQLGGPATPKSIGFGDGTHMVTWGEAPRFGCRSGIEVSLIC